jgi:methylated-DNA-[protein]-cysteine S-methyltransferase
MKGTKMTTLAATDQLTFTTVDTPYDQLLLVGSSAGLVRIALEREGFHEVLSELEERAQASAIEAGGQLDEPRRQLEEYFAGERTRFSVDLDLEAIGGFRRRALEAMAAIPFGETRTYRQLAEVAGNRAAVRAAGGACATNPWPVIMPCHRVVRSDGGLGGYLGGLEMKRGLLALEAAGS